MVTLRSFDLLANNEGMDRRAFNRFTLYSGDGSGSWAAIYDTGSGFSYGPGSENVTENVTPVSAQYFRAEFVQAPWTDRAAVGPRIIELDGFDTFLDGSTGSDGIPEPSTLVICSLLGLVGFGLVRRRRR